MRSKAATVEAYLAELPPDRREALSAIRRVILDNLDEGFEEGMGYGMISYHVPHRLYPDGYHCDPKMPLPYAGLASQKQYISVYLMSAYMDGTGEERWFRQAWAKSGKKLDMGKCCVRFKRLEDAALDVIGEAIRRVPMKKHIARYEQLLATRQPSKPAKRATAARSVTAKVTRKATKKASKGTLKPTRKKGVGRRG